MEEVPSSSSSSSLSLSSPLDPSSSSSSNDMNNNMNNNNNNNMNNNNINNVISKLYVSNNVRWRHARTMEMLHFVNKENTDLKEQLLKSQCEIKSNGMINNQNENELNNAKSKICYLEETIIKLKMEFKDFKSNMEMENNELNKHLLNDQQKQQQQRNQMMMETNMMEYNKKNEYLNNEMKKLEIENEKYKKEISILEKENSLFKSTSDSDMEKLKIAEQEIMKMERIIEEKNGDITHLNHSLQCKENSYDELQLRFMTQEQHLRDEMNDNMEDIRKDGQRLQNEVDQLTHNNAELVLERDLIERKCNAEMANLENEFYRIQRDLNQERSINTHMEESYRQSKENMEEKIKKLENKITSISKHLAGRSHFAEFVGLKHENRTLSSQLDEMKYKHISFRTAAEKRIKDCENEVDKKTQQNVKKANWASSVSIKSSNISRKKSSSLGMSCNNNSMNNSMNNLNNNNNNNNNYMNYHNQNDNKKIMNNVVVGNGGHDMSSAGAGMQAFVTLPSAENRMPAYGNSKNSGKIFDQSDGNCSIVSNLTDV